MKDQPEDKFNLVYLIFGWLGIGTLLPWNFFITVTAYWDAKWQDPVQFGANSSSGGNVVLERNEMQTNWNSNMAMASMIPNVTFLLLNAVFGHHFRTTPRLLVSLIFVILLFGATCAMTKIDTNEYQHEFYIGTLVSCVLININSAIFQGKTWQNNFRNFLVKSKLSAAEQCKTVAFSRIFSFFRRTTRFGWKIPKGVHGDRLQWPSYRRHFR